MVPLRPSRRISWAHAHSTCSLSLEHLNESHIRRNLELLWAKNKSDRWWWWWDDKTSTRYPSTYAIGNMNGSSNRAITSDAPAIGLKTTETAMRRKAKLNYWLWLGRVVPNSPSSCQCSSTKFSIHFRPLRWFIHCTLDPAFVWFG